MCYALILPVVDIYSPSYQSATPVECSPHHIITAPETDEEMVEHFEALPGLIPQVVPTCTSSQAIALLPPTRAHSNSQPWTKLWPQTLEQLHGMFADKLAQCQPPMVCLYFKYMFS